MHVSSLLIISVPELRGQLPFLKDMKALLVPAASVKMVRTLMHWSFGGGRGGDCHIREVGMKVRDLKSNPFCGHGFNS